MSVESTRRRNASPNVPGSKLEDYGKVGDIALSDVPALVDTSVGIEPTEYNIIIAPAVQREKIGSLFIPDSAKESYEMARQLGRIVAVSEVAFNYEPWPEEGRGPPRLGDVVWFARYAGGLVEGRDGKTYRLVKDKDIGAIVSRWSGAYPDGFDRFGRLPVFEAQPWAIDAEEEENEYAEVTPERVGALARAAKQEKAFPELQQREPAIMPTGFGSRD